MDLPGRFLVRQREQDDGQRGKDKSGHQLIQAEPCKLLPDEDDHAAGQDTRIGALEGHALPVEGEQRHRTEAGAEAGPRVGHDLENVAVRIGGEIESAQRNRQHGEAAHEDQFLFTGFSVKKGLIKVAGYCGGRDEKLRRGGTHDGCQNSGPDEACDERCGQIRRHDDEYPFGIGIFQRRGQIGLANDADDDGKEEGDDDPAHGDAGGFFQLRCVADGHEAYKDVRLAEVAEAPAERGDEHNEIGEAAGGFREQGEEVRPFSCEDVHGGDRAAQRDGGSDRNIEHGEEHHGALNEVGPADGAESAEERIEYHHEGANEKSCSIGQSENGIEELARRNESGRGVNDEEDDDAHRTDEAEAVPVVLKPVGQIIRNGEAVAGDLGVGAEAFGDEYPVQPGADDEADARPDGGQTVQVGKARQPHEHPAAHIGCLGAHGGEPRAELAVAQNVLRQIFLFS